MARPTTTLEALEARFATESPEQRAATRAFARRKARELGIEPPGWTGPSRSAPPAPRVPPPGVPLACALAEIAAWRERTGGAVLATPDGGVLVFGPVAYRGEPVARNYPTITAAIAAIA